MTKLSITFFSTVLLLAGSFAASNALADKVYRWVDENGRVHYSSQPRRGVDEDKYRVQVDRVTPPPPKPAVEKTEQPAEQETSDITQQRETRAKELCANAKEVKEVLSTNFSRRFKQDDGSYRPLTDDERASKMAEADKRIKEYCQ